MSQRTTMLAGLILIIAALATVASVVLTATSTSEKDPFERDEVAEYLTEINDNETGAIAAGAVALFSDGVMIPLAAAALFILFRDRNPFLAAVTMVALAVAASVALVVDGTSILLTIVADDFVNGGAGDIPPGDPATLELGRYLGMVSFAFINVLFTAVATGFLALGILLVSAPQGIVNPPKWIGWVTIISGASAGLAWLVVAADPFFVFFPILLISQLVFMIGLGVWLLQHSDLEPAPMRA